MIAVFNKDGSIKPIRFRVETEDESDKVIKIVGVKHVYEEKLIDKSIMRKYICLIELNDMQRLCELGYNLSTMKWTLVKI
jgi:hypothetical protein